MLNSKSTAICRTESTRGISRADMQERSVKRFARTQSSCRQERVKSMLLSSNIQSKATEDDIEELPIKSLHCWLVFILTLC